MLRKGMFISDRYEIIDKVGSGGMSDVYKALCHKLNRYVAIKVLKQEFSEDKNFVSKFKIEAQSAAGLSHPNIVNVYDVGEDNGLHYIVMELIEGITLKKYIDKKGQLPVKEAVSICIQVAQGIEAAHNNHIIHRDIKPQNIIISKEGKVKVTDFGIARAASTNTISSNAMGSVHYISPEQAKGGFIDEKSDIYSLGVTLYEMLTGKVPFEGDSTVAIALQHVQNDIPSPKRLVPDLPVSVEKIILKCTQKKPDRRYLKVSSLIADLKKSLITPDEDFVQIVSVDEGAATVMISDDEISQIRHESGFEKPELDIPVIGKDNHVMELEDEEEIEDDLETDEENPKLDKIIAIGGIVTAVIIVIAMFFILTNIVGDGCSPSNPAEKKTTTAEDETTLDAKHSRVPKVVGVAEDDAIALLKKEDLGYRIETDYHNTIEKGFVISSSVEEGTIVEKHTTIILTVSDGAKEFDVPDIVGKNKEEARTILKDEYGLNPEFEYKPDAVAPLDTVIETSPKAPQQVKYGDSITVYLSSGADSTDTTVPNLAGETKDGAKAKLEMQKLKLGQVHEEYHDTIAAGLVTRQDVPADSKLPEGATVNIWISKGVEPNPKVPSIAGMSVEKAKEELEKAGLKLGRKQDEQYHDTIPKNSIIRSTVTDGTTVEKGSSIDYIVSLGKEPESTTPEPTPEPTTPEPTTPEPTTAEKKRYARISVNYSDLDRKYVDEDGNTQEITEGILSASMVTHCSDGRTITQEVSLSTNKLNGWTGENISELVDKEAESVWLTITVEDRNGPHVLFNNKMYLVEE